MAHKLEWYRPNVALIIEKKNTGLVLVCRRIGSPEWWQFPQGGVDENETLWQAALRECAEEVGLKEVELLSQTEGWLTYDFPSHVYKSMKNRGWNYVGQKQKYFYVRYHGEDQDIKFDQAQEIEFDAYQWVEPLKALNLVVDFKKRVYQEALIELGLIHATIPHL